MARIKGRGIGSIVCVSAKERGETTDAVFQRAFGASDRRKRIRVLEDSPWGKTVGSQLEHRCRNAETDFRLRSKHDANLNR